MEPNLSDPGTSITPTSVQPSNTPPDTPPRASTGDAPERTQADADVLATEQGPGQPDTDPTWAQKGKWPTETPAKSGERSERSPPRDDLPLRRGEARVTPELQSDDVQPPKRTVKEWRAGAKEIELDKLALIIGDPIFRQDMMRVVEAWVAKRTEEVRPNFNRDQVSDPDSRYSGSLLDRVPVVGKSAMYDRARDAPQYREYLREELTLLPGGHDDIPLLLDFIRDVGSATQEAVKRVVTDDWLRKQRSSRHLQYMEKNVHEGVENLIQECGLTAYDKARSDRIGPMVGLTASTLSPLLCWAYAALSMDPWYLMTQMVRGAVQSSPIAVGLYRDKALGWGQVREYTADFQATWIITALGVGAAVFADHVANTHPQDQHTLHAAQKLDKVFATPAYLVGAGLVMSVSYLFILSEGLGTQVRRGLETVANNTAGRAFGKELFLEPDFAAGRMRIPLPPESADPGAQALRAKMVELQDLTRFLDEMSSTLEVVKKIWTREWSAEQKAGYLSALQKIDRGETLLPRELDLLRDARGKFSSVGEAEAQHHTAVDAARERSIKTTQLMVGGVGGGGEIPAGERRDKRNIGLRYVLPAEAVTLAVQTIGSWSNKALALETASYYLVALGNSLAKILSKSVRTTAFLKDFGSRFGGALFNLIPAVLNTVFQLRYNEDFLGLTSRNSTEQHFFNRPVTQHPDIHWPGGTGKGNFTLYDIFSITVNTLWKAGDVLQSQIVDRLRSPAALSEADELRKSIDPALVARMLSVCDAYADKRRTHPVTTIDGPEGMEMVRWRPEDAAASGALGDTPGPSEIAAAEAVGAQQRHPRAGEAEMDTPPRTRDGRRPSTTDDAPSAGVAAPDTNEETKEQEMRHSRSHSAHR